MIRKERDRRQDRMGNGKRRVRASVKRGKGKEGRKVRREVIEKSKRESVFQEQKYSRKKMKHGNAKRKKK